MLNPKVQENEVKNYSDETKNDEVEEDEKQSVEAVVAIKHAKASSIDASSNASEAFKFFFKFSFRFSVITSWCNFTASRAAISFSTCDGLILSMGILISLNLQLLQYPFLSIR